MIEIEKILGIELKSTNNDDEIKMVEKKTAWIEEKDCIGCSKCARICPAKAIVGIMRTTHTVISNYCNNCNLCIESCPVDCIKIIPIKIFISHLEWDSENLTVKLDVLYKK
ncbi:hypothetical protein CRV11_00865 [Candidatus Pantoea edessiphila]|uniref:4Fe-4S ferredoxin-type domain-containing protein n=1 Tax=Candidatus Pantoea edessiphila TaxID=2044610 RepID=A0A2P5SYU8_9GAMM|nr:RnfABCDGE type electron transport complex subunit B [Candidatus Pantoea edessiphila]MBK4775397.1 RnfABCDGE type electron transport complex subunit B [Pantoea sp. Edef]PPI87473.1 hypothetical protein CRV11_00865 [Candidatus Pantoea edessiphila]